MNLPPDFRFSQGSLQDFVECRRRFQLRYLLRQSWPAVPSEPLLEMERTMQQGARFHRIVQQHRLGLPVERLAPLAQEADLSGWWESYLRFSQGGGLQALAGADATFYPEITLTAPLGDFRLLAKLVEPANGHVVWMAEASKSYDDQFSHDDIDEVEAGLYAFTKPPRESRNWGRIVEPVVVSGIIVGLIYLFFSNQGD